MNANSFNLEELLSAALRSEKTESERNLLKEFCESIHQLGYAYLQLHSHLAQKLDALRTQATAFFNLATPDEKAKLCCESVNSADSRDRLELRYESSKKYVVPCLNRGQYYEGFNTGDGQYERHLLANYFPPDGSLASIFQEIEEIAHCIANILCEHVRFKLQDLLRQEDIDSNGVGRFGASILRILKYPTDLAASNDLSPTDVSQNELAQDHTDIGLITVMPCSSVPGLQVLSSDFEWLDVEQGIDTTYALVVVGEQLAYLSNYYYRALRHRVIRPKGSDRISFPFLLRLSSKCEIRQIGTGKIKVAREIQNKVFTLTRKSQLALKCARELTNRFQQVAQSKSFKQKEVVLVASGSVEPTQTTWNTNHNELPCLVLLTIWESKMPSRGHFLDLMKAIQATNFKYTRYDPWETAEGCKSQIATFLAFGHAVTMLFVNLNAVNTARTHTDAEGLKSLINILDLATPLIGEAYFRH